MGELKDTVMAIHIGRICYVIDMFDNTSAESPFDGNVDRGALKYSSFSEYFHKGEKDEIVVFYPEKPLLLLQQTYNPIQCSNPR